MSKKTRGFIIPDDWDGTSYTLQMACVPDSPQWISVFKGCVYLLTRGYSWDDQSGSVIAAQDIGKEVYNSMAFCDQLLAAVLEISNTLKMNSCGCVIGQGADSSDGEQGGSIPDPIGDIVYEEPSTAPNRDCKAANSVHETLTDLVGQLDAYNVDDMSVLGLALVVSIVAAALASVATTPVGGLIAAVAGAVAVFAARLIGVTVDLGSMHAIMLSYGEDLVCELYEATTATGARDAYLLFLETNGMSSIEADLLGLVMTNGLLNILFFDTPETAAFWPTYTPTYDCSTCPSVIGCNWKFSDDQGDTGTGNLDKSGAQRTLTATLGSGSYYRVHIELETSSGNPGFECDGNDTINAEYIVMNTIPATPTFTTHHPWKWVGEVWTNPGDWPNPSEQQTRYGAKLLWTDQDPFTVDIKLNPGNFEG